MKRHVAVAGRQTNKEGDPTYTHGRLTNMKKVTHTKDRRASTRDTCTARPKISTKSASMMGPEVLTEGMQGCITRPRIVKATTRTTYEQGCSRELIDPAQQVDNNKEWREQRSKSKAI